MFKCTYCDRELKSKAGLTRHEKSCKEREVADVAEVEEVVSAEETKPEVEPTKEVIKPTKEVVQLEVVGENNYYVGHPRRETKLKGLLSRTFDQTERMKILMMLNEIADERLRNR